MVGADADGWVVGCCGTAPSDVLDEDEDDGGDGPALNAYAGIFDA